MRAVFLFTILFFLNEAKAQEMLRPLHDVDGQLMEYYTPSKQLRISHNVTSFEKGYYYKNDGSKIRGLIKLNDNKIICLSVCFPHPVPSIRYS